MVGVEMRFLYLECESNFLEGAIWVMNNARALGGKKCDRRCILFIISSSLK